MGVANLAKEAHSKDVDSNTKQRKRHNMRNSQLRIFLAIAAQEYRTTYSIASDIGITSSSVSRHLKYLEDNSLISRGYRNKNIRWYLTPTGKEVAARYATPERQLPPVDVIDVECVEVDTTPVPEGEIRHPVYNKLENYLRGGIRFVWLTGEAGVGKTFAVEQIAENLGMELFLSTPVCDKYELMGFNDAHGNAVETEVYKWATHDGPALLLLDEVDGNLAPALLALNSLLANGIGVFPNGKVRIGDDKYVIATANTTGQGATIKYCGRQALDRAFIDRFETKLHWGLHEATEKFVALKKVPGCADVVAASWKIRRNLSRYGIDCDWGPRRTYALCRKAVCCGVSVREAAVDAGLSDLSKEEQENALEGVR